VRQDESLPEKLPNETNPRKSMIAIAGGATRQEYLQRAYRLGHEFAPGPAPA
jgi:hypothetical protein